MSDTSRDVRIRIFGEKNPIQDSTTPVRTADGVETPMSSSWLIVVERWFREITYNRSDVTLRQHASLITATKGYLAHENNETPGVVWNASVEPIIARSPNVKKR